MKRIELIARTPSRRAVLAGAAGAAAVFPFGAFPVPAIAQGALDKVNIVNTQGMATQTVQDVMKRRGYLADMKVDPNIVYVADASKLMGSLLSGESDICMFSGIGSVLTAIEKGAKIKLVGGSLVKLEHAVYTKRDNIRTVQDLAGKTIGSGSSGALLHTMMIALLRKHGVDERSVKFVNIGGTPDVFRAVAAGVVDAGISEIDVYDQQDKFGVHVIKEGNLWKELPEFTFQGAYASEKAIREKRDGLVRTLAAYAKLYRFLSSAESEQTYVDAQTSLSRRASVESARWQWKFFHDTQIYATDLVLSEERVRYMQGLNLSLGVQKRIVPYADAADMSLARDALKLLS